MQFRRPVIRLHTVLQVLVLALCAPHAAQSLPLVNLGGGQSKNSEQKKPDTKELQQSLDVVIQTLQDDQKRQHLLKQLEALRQSTGAAGGKQSKAGAEHGGLLDALSYLFGQNAGQHGNRKSGSTPSPIDSWTRHSRQAFQQARSLSANTSRQALARTLVETVVGLGVWLGAVLGLALLARLLFNYGGWPVVLPTAPRPWMLLAHILRRVLPWLVTFFALLYALPAAGMRLPALTTVLVLAYAGLCARVLTTIFDTVAGSFNRGHRRTAVAILHHTALKPLFAIGALVALGDALASARLAAQLGTVLANWLSAAASVLAALISAWLIVRIRRPIEHLIRNRPYSRRRKQRLGRDLMDLLARLWFIPALLVVGATLVAIFMTGHRGEAAFAKALLCAILLVFTFVITDLLRRESRRLTHGRRASPTARRLEQVVVTLVQLGVWTLFAALSLRVWGYSLFGLGQPAAFSPRVIHALVGVGMTFVIAWMAWVFVDLGIQRALGGNDRKKTTARAQTVTPMLRTAAICIILIIGIIVALANLGINVTPLLAGAGIIGLALGFGAQTLVQDLITGIFILVEDSMAVGDWVEINGVTGGVEGLNLRTVRFRDIDGIVHYVTFSHITAIHNMSRQYGIALMKIRIPHDMPIDDAIKLMRDTANELRDQAQWRSLIWTPLEIQGIHAFDDGCPILRMRMRTAPIYQWDVARAFNLLLKQRMEEQYVNLAAPRMSISMEAGGGQHFTRKGEAEQQTTDSSDGPQPQGAS